MQCLMLTRMCGIAGLYTKSPALREQLGAQLSAMLAQLSDRGPDSAGVAFYRDPAPPGCVQGVAAQRDARPGLGAARGRARRGVRRRRARRSVRATPLHVRRSTAEADDAQAWLAEHHPELTLMSAGRVDRDLQGGRAARRSSSGGSRSSEIAGSHALGHTRMATESRVTTEHSHPFSTGLDLCLVHNGSLSNHNRLRRALRREGIRFQTDNDSEVAAGLPDVAAARGRDARAGARRVPRRPRRLLHVRGRDGDGLRGAARSDRVQAGGHGRDRRVGGDGLGVPGDRGAARRRGRGQLGAGAGSRLQLGSGARWRDGGDGGHPGRGPLVRPGERHRPRAQPAPAQRSTRPARRSRGGGNPGGKHAIAVGLDAPYEVEIEGHVGYYCAGMNKQATIRVRGNCGVGSPRT